MMNWLIKSFLILLVICLALFLTVRTIDKDNDLIKDLIVNDDESDEEEEEEERISIIDGFKAIELAEEVVEASGLKFESLKSISIRPEFIAYAEVVDIQPLVSLKVEYLELLSDLKVLQNDLYNHNKILKRAEALHQAKSISTRDLEKTRFERDRKTSELNAANARLNGFVFKVQV